MPTCWPGVTPPGCGSSPSPHPSGSVAAPPRWDCTRSWSANPAGRRLRRQLGRAAHAIAGPPRWRPGARGLGPGRRARPHHSGDQHRRTVGVRRLQRRAGRCRHPRRVGRAGARPARRGPRVRGRLPTGRRRRVSTRWNWNGSGNATSRRTAASGCSPASAAPAGGRNCRRTASRTVVRECRTWVDLHGARHRSQPGERRGDLQRPVRAAPQRGDDRGPARRRSGDRRGSGRPGRAVPGSCAPTSTWSKPWRADRITVVMNKIRASAIGPGPGAQVAQTLQRFGGITAPVLVPYDQPGAGCRGAERQNADGCRQEVAGEPGDRQVRRRRTSSRHPPIGTAAGALAAAAADTAAGASDRAASEDRRAQANLEGVSTLSDLVYAQGRSERGRRRMAAPARRRLAAARRPRLRRHRAVGAVGATTASSRSRTPARRARPPCSTATSSARTVRPEWRAQVHRGVRDGAASSTPPRPTGSRRPRRACARCR